MLETLKEKGCVKGCGGCCKAQHTPKKIETAEKMLATRPPQYPDSPLEGRIPNKSIIVQHEDGTQTSVYRLCPFAYAADSHDTPLEGWTAQSGTYPQVDKTGTTPQPTTQILVPGPKDFAILCGIHQQIRDDPAIHQLFWACEMWNYHFSKVYFSRDVCETGVREYQNRISSAKKSITA